MAHVEKYTAAATGHMLAHYDRTHSSSTSLIDESRTALNHNLAGIDQPLPQLDFLHKRLGEIKVMKRADVNVMCDWIVTAPKELTPEELPLFFNETYKFLNERYGKENVISAYVHMDETSPHIHYAFVPVVIDKKKGIPKFSAKERITRKDLNTFHPDLTKRMTAVFGRDIGIQNDATALGNQTIKQLRQKTKNMEKFKAEPVPVTEIPPVVKKFLKEDKVIISRRELDRVNKAAEDAAIIMSNAEAVNAQLAEKAAKPITTIKNPRSIFQRHISRRTLSYPMHRKTPKAYLPPFPQTKQHGNSRDQYSRLSLMSVTGCRIAEQSIFARNSSAMMIKRNATISLQPSLILPPQSLMKRYVNSRT